MIDPLKLLGDVKGKVLDAMHFDLLKSAYELQNHNVEQLKENNGALNESNKLLKEKAAGLEAQVTSLKAEVVALRKQLPEDRAPYKPTGLALRILQLYRDRDSSSLEDLEMVHRLGCGKVQFEIAIEELQAAKILRVTSMRAPNILDERDTWGGTTYTLNEDAKKMIFNLPKE